MSRTNFIRITKKAKRSRSATFTGFTIIEILVVLAIAGLILLIVFLGIPALQRSARNDARKQEASRIATVMTTYVNNNGGVLPGTEGGSDNQAAWVADCKAFSIDVGRLTQFGDGSSSGLSSWCVADESHAASANEFVDDYTWYGPVSSSSGTAAWLVYTLFASCPASPSTTVAAVAAGAKQSVLFYPLEASGGNQIIQCIQVT